MKYKTVAMIAAILSFLNAAFFILAPVLTLSLLGRDTNLTGIMNTRLFGACALGLAVITWLARDTKYPDVRTWVSYGMAITLGLLAVIDLNGIITGAMNYLGWIMFVADLSLSLCFILSIFTDGGQLK
jgi:hypothetical protein